MSRLVVATVPYVNAAPLVWGFTHGSLRGSVDLVAELPSRIPDLLRSGRVDAGLVPVIETQRVEGLEIHPALCIASRERARSVILACRRPLSKVRRIALDASSRSSAALLRVLLAGRGLEGIEFTERPPALPAMLENADAALLIGDPALRADTSGLEVVDLAAEWSTLTGLPFVFAVWAVRSGVMPAASRDLFAASHGEGLARIDAIAADHASRLGLPPESVADYLRVNIHYHLGAAERRAIDLFFDRAHALGLIDLPRPLSYLPGREPSAAAPGAPPPPAIESGSATRRTLQ